METEILSPLETHPWEPFIPENAKILIMGTFPPGSHRWSMNFYYPNRTNDFWRIMGMIFYQNKDALIQPDSKQFDITAIKSLLNERGIALSDTGLQIRRLKGNASDKFLEIVTPRNLADLLEKMPDCRTVATTGEKAAQVVANQTGTSVPKTGEMTTAQFVGRKIDIWRMPSTSRAYPLQIEKKAALYESMFRKEGII